MTSLRKCMLQLDKLVYFIHTSQLLGSKTAKIMKIGLDDTINYLSCSWCG